MLDPVTKITLSTALSEDMKQWLTTINVIQITRVS